MGREWGRDQNTSHVAQEMKEISGQYLLILNWFSDVESISYATKSSPIVNSFMCSFTKMKKDSQMFFCLSGWKIFYMQRCKPSSDVTVIPNNQRRSHTNILSEWALAS